MALRDNIFQQFGPLMQEALVSQLLDEINELRTALGKPPRPFEAYLGMVHNNHAHLVPYNWMTEQENFPP